MVVVVLGDKVDVLLVGAGEYTTGFVHGAASSSDKKIGVVGLVMFDLRRRGLVNNIFIADIDGEQHRCSFLSTKSPD